MHISVSRNKKFFLSIFRIQIYLIGVLYFTRYKKDFRSVLLPGNVKKISSKNLRYISENVLING